MNHRQQAALRVVFAWCLAGVAACGGGGGAPQQPENTTFIIQTTERLQGLPETYAPNRPIYGYHMFDQPGATGSVTQVNSVSNSQGKIYVVDGRVPARWHLVWTAYPCQGRFWEGNIPGGLPPVTVTLSCIVVSGSFFSPSSLGYITGWVPDEYWEQEPDWPDPPGPGGAGTMSEAANQYLYPDSAVVYSPSGQFRLQYQDDGNLVLVDTWSGWTPVWASGTNDNNPGWVAMQGDGNFVIYNGNSQPVWSTGTQGNNGAYLFIADNGSLVLFNPDGSFALWWSTGVW